jgi:parallel beta-helix repeat protein
MHPWRILTVIIAIAFQAFAAEIPLPHLTLTRDDTVITQSCIIDLPLGAIFQDRNNNGVLQIEADDIRVRFANNAELRGATNNTPWNQLTGVGIRINGHKNVTIENIRIHGFKTAIGATAADNLLISDADLSDNFRQRLKSTRLAESNDDWLYPHNNDRTKWRDQYGAAIAIENSSHITIRRVKVRRGQNGILLDRVNDSAIYDNDCSYLSGWGLALWRSNGNRITRNAFDFCIRGHFEDAYNRGQDSAGILCFEQSNDNLFAQNSATHGGDGFFGFAGHEAIGENWWKAERARLQKTTGQQNVDAQIQVTPELARLFSSRGCNGNILIDNDFSYASAHGIELTFSENNQILRNRIVENGVTGFWGGYDSATLIAENEFKRNGGMAYGAERGAINMEHAFDNLILKNHFENNRCAISLWWDDDGALMRYPGVAGNNPGVLNNIIARNSFEITPDLHFKRLPADARIPMIEIRDPSQTHTKNNFYIDNQLDLNHGLATEYQLDEAVRLDRAGDIPDYTIPRYTPLGEKHPIGARRALRSRTYIIIDEWGPKQYD